MPRARHLTFRQRCINPFAMRIQSVLHCLTATIALFTLSIQAAPATFKVSDLTFSRPEKWEWIETTSSMRAAQLKVSDEKTKQSAEVIFFYFGPGGGGGVQANVDRWLGQFSEPREKLNSKTEETTVNGTKVTYVQAEGTYQSGMPGGPKTPQPNSALVGAIVEAKQGAVFVRMVGSKDLAKASVADFKKMIEGALKN
jgi:hypothetical protein